MAVPDSVAWSAGYVFSLHILGTTNDRNTIITLKTDGSSSNKYIAWQRLNFKFV